MEPDRRTDPALADVLEALIQREPIFHRPEFGTTRAAFEAMTAPEFWETGASGQRYAREHVLDVLDRRHAQPHADVWETSDFHCQALAPALYLLTYTLAQGTRRTRRTTLWRHEDGDWKIVYHQGTVVADAPPTQTLGHVALVVRDYDEALAFYVGVLGFRLVEDSYQPAQDKRWVLIAPPGSRGTQLLLARASDAEQAAHIGNQTGGRVFLFLFTDDFARDYAAYRDRGVTFVREPRQEAYGTVAVFRDLYGNLWDLLQPAR